MAYVMMGRVENVQNLYITGTFDEKKIRCDKKALQEALRLERISLSWKTRDVCYLSIVSMNVRSLVKHQRDVLADYKVLQNVICIAQCLIILLLRLRLGTSSLLSLVIIFYLFVFTA